MSAPPSDVRLAARYLAASIRSQLQYRASVVMLSTGRLLASLLEFFAIWALFQRFDSIGGWSLAEVCVLYGMANVAFATAEALGRGFAEFSHAVRRGDFDRVLLRPRGTALQIGAHHFDLQRIARFTQGVAILSWGLATVDASWTAPQLVLVLLAIAAGACVFLGIFILQGATAFWTIETLEVFSTVTYGGVEAAQYPLSIYSDGLRRFFTYVLPLACANYLPAAVLLDRPEVAPTWASWTSPLIGPVFLVVCLQVWRIGVRHYQSTGS